MFLGPKQKIYIENFHKFAQNVFFCLFFAFKVTRIIFKKPNTVRPFNMLEKIPWMLGCSLYISVNKINAVLIRFSACVFLQARRRTLFKFCMVEK